MRSLFLLFSLALSWNCFAQYEREKALQDFAEYGASGNGKLEPYQKKDEGSKFERLGEVEKYLADISKSYLALQKKVSEMSSREFNALKKRVEVLERGSDGGCCSLVNNSNLPKMTEDITFAKNKINEVETTVNSIRSTDMAKIKAEIQLINSTLESLKGLLKDNSKIKK